MEQRAQYFLPVAAIEAIWNDIIQANQFGQYGGGGGLKGLILTPGKDENGEIRLFPFPVFEVMGKPITETVIIVQNMALKYAGCPYPPPCREAHQDQSQSTG